MKKLFTTSLNKLKNKKLFVRYHEKMKKNNSVTKSVVYTIAGIIIGLLAKGI